MEMVSVLMSMVAPEMFVGGLAVSFVIHMVLNRRSFVSLAVSASLPPARPLILSLFANEARPMDAQIAYWLAVITVIAFLIALLGALLGCWAALSVRRFFRGRYS